MRGDNEAGGECKVYLAAISICSTGGDKGGGGSCGGETVRLALLTSGTTAAVAVRWLVVGGVG